MIVAGVAVLALCGLALRHLPDSYFWSGVVTWCAVVAGYLALVAIAGTIAVTITQ